MTGFEARISLIAQRLDEQEQGIWASHDRALAMIEAGEDVLLLSVGDPDLPTLDSIIDHAAKSLRDGRTHYSPGMGELELRRVIARIEERASDRPCSVDEILIFPGATNAIFTVLSCLIDPGDEVVVSEPMYIGYSDIFRILEARVQHISPGADRNFKLDPALLEAAISDRTRVVLLNTPGNPSGSVIAGEELRDIASLCLEKNIWLVSDEVYSMITFEEKHVSARTAAESLDNVIVVDGLSKSHAMTGWRMGWVVAAESLVQSFLAFTSATVFGCSQFVQDAAAFAMENDEAYMARVRDVYRRRRDFVCGKLATIPRISFCRPGAGMFVMIDVSAVAPDGESFAQGLLETERVSLLPGSGFGASTKGFVRLSLTQDIPLLEEALARIDRYISRLP